MATDRLMNHTQGESIVSALQTIAQKSETPYNASNKLPTDYAYDTNQTNKFATAAQLEQIELNKNNISYIENTGKKNWLKPDTISGVPTGINIQYESDDSITINGTYSGSDYAYVFLHSFSHEAMRYTLSCNVETKASTFYFYTRDGHMQTTQTLTYTYSDSDTTQIVMRIAPNTSFSNKNVKLMIRPSIIADSTYQPFAFSNAELTAKEQVNENNIYSLETNRARYQWGNTSTSASSCTITFDSDDVAAAGNKLRGSMLFCFPTQNSGINNSIVQVDFVDGAIKDARLITNTANEQITSIGTISGLSITINIQSNSYARPASLSFLSVPLSWSIS